MNRKSFSRCESLSQVNIPSAVNAVDNNAFYKCKTLGETSFSTKKDLYELENSLSLRAIL
eukprot:scaffold1344_cov102-Cylindrotheca_fusiformis.AAC.6